MKSLLIFLSVVILVSSCDLFPPVDQELPLINPETSISIISNTTSKCIFEVGTNLNIASESTISGTINIANTWYLNGTPLSNGTVATTGDISSDITPKTLEGTQVVFELPWGESAILVGESVPVLVGAEISFSTNDDEFFEMDKTWTIIVITRP